MQQNPSLQIREIEPTPHHSMVLQDEKQIRLAHYLYTHHKQLRALAELVCSEPYQTYIQSFRDDYKDAMRFLLLATALYQKMTNQPQQQQVTSDSMSDRQIELQATSRGRGVPWILCYWIHLFLTHEPYRIQCTRLLQSLCP